MNRGVTYTTYILHTIYVYIDTHIYGSQNKYTFLFYILMNLKYMLLLYITYIYNTKHWTLYKHLIHTKTKLHEHYKEFTSIYTYSNN